MTLAIRESGVKGNAFINATAWAKNTFNRDRSADVLGKCAKFCAVCNNYKISKNRRHVITLKAKKLCRYAVPVFSTGGSILATQLPSKAQVPTIDLTLYDTSPLTLNRYNAGITASGEIVSGRFFTQDIYRPGDTSVNVQNNFFCFEFSRSFPLTDLTSGSSYFTAALFKKSDLIAGNYQQGRPINILSTDFSPSGAAAGRYLGKFYSGNYLVSSGDVLGIGFIPDPNSNDVNILPRATKIDVNSNPLGDQGYQMLQVNTTSGGTTVTLVAPGNGEFYSGWNSGVTSAPEPITATLFIVGAAVGSLFYRSRKK